ncbi:MAG: 16S rRNA (adenine(1518)-N(6)/adenine(1519)-N(6))-dimethyltransferase RsmA [Candidatus Bipolaricaulaceae bacterium]
MTDPAEMVISPAALSRLLQRRGVRLRKELGQHFLVDEEVRRCIVEAAAPAEGEAAVEVGAGVGTLTLPVARLVGRLWAVEVDPRLAAILREHLRAFRNVEVVEGSFLDLGLAALGQDLLVVGNLPYQITSLTLAKLLRERGAVGRAVLMVQREAAGKLLAPPGPRTSRLGVHLSAYFHLELVRRVPCSAFFPPPDVDGAVIRLARLAQPRIQAPEETFARLLGSLYGARRKTVRRALAISLPRRQVDQLLAKADIDPRVRGEALPLAALDRLAQAIAESGPRVSRGD